MDRLNAYRAYARVVELGSFAKAADRLDVSTSAVSRLVADLEAHLDVRLLNRTTRKLSLTEAGQTFYERCVALLADVDEAEASVRASALLPKGTLRITCGVSFGVRYLSSAIADFGARHPQVVFDLDLSDRAVDLVDEGFDLAVRIGHIGSQGLVSRRIGWTRLVCCASPAYVAKHGAPATPEELTAHSCLTYTHVPVPNVWTFADREGTTHSVRIAARHRSNNGRMCAALAVDGLGIAFEPDFIVAPDVRAGRLVRLMPDYEPPRSPIAAVYPSRRHLSAKVRTFVDFIAERFDRQHDWQIAG